jgi:pimeloyl-ACP methyl ester carboxylesterase
MRPATYGRLVNLLATRCRVVVPDLFAVRGRWRSTEVLEAFAAALDHLGLDQVSLLGHSFGGGLELDFATRSPGRVVELVFSDTLAVSRQFRLAQEATRHPGRLLRLATPPAASAFLYNWTLHPRQMVGAAWWGFASGRVPDSEAVTCDGIPAHVMWANRDSILSRSDGQQFARDLDATFTVASAPDGRPMDHDWMFQQPDVFVDHLDRLGLKVLSG